MNKQEYKQWRMHASFALCRKYSYDDSERVLRWFDNISGSQEIDLVGLEAVEHLCAVWNTVDFDMYASLTARVWIYAPYILKQRKE